MGRMRTSLVLAKASLETQLQYPLNLLGDLLLICMSLAARFVFVEAIFANTNVLAGWNSKEMTLLAIAVSIIGLGVDALSSSINQAVGHALQGNALPVFLRPDGSLLYALLRWCKVAHAFLFLIALFLFPVAGKILGFTFAVTKAIAAMIALLMSATICTITLFYFLAISLWVQRHLPATYIFQQLFKFSQIPSTLLSQKGMGILLIFPMFWVASVPTLLLLGRANDIHCYILISALLVCLPIKIVAERALRASTQIGG